MFKILTKLALSAFLLVLLKSHQDLLAMTSNFMVDGVVPMTNFALNEFWSGVTVVIMTGILLRSIANLRHKMLARRAQLYTEHKQMIAKQAEFISESDEVFATATPIQDSEELELQALV